MRIFLPAVQGLTLTPSSTEQGRIEVSWDARAGVETYRYSWKGAGAEQGSTSGTSFTITGLMPGRTVSVRVDYSDARTATASLLIPYVGAPAVPVPAPFVNGLTIGLLWNTVPFATGYDYRYRIGSGAWTPPVEVSGNRASFNGVAGNAYEIQVRSKSPGGTSAWSKIVTASIVMVGGTIIEASASAATDNRIDLSWGAATGATSYQVQQRAGSDSWSDVYTGSNRSTTFDGVNLRAYAFRVRGLNGAIAGAWSPVVSWRAVNLSPGVVTGLSVSERRGGKNNDRVGWDASWSAAPRATAYEYEWFPGGPGMTKGRSASVSGTFGVSFRVRGTRGGADPGPWSRASGGGGGGGGDDFGGGGCAGDDSPSCAACVGEDPDAPPGPQ